MKKSDTSLKTAVDTSTRKAGTPDLPVEAPPISLLKAGESLDKGYASWVTTLVRHVHHLPDLMNAIRTKIDPDFNALVIKEAEESRAADETAMEQFLAAVGATNLSKSQKEQQQFEEAMKLKSLASARRTKYEDNKRTLVGKLFNTNTFISETVKIQVKNEMGPFSAEDLLKEKAAEGSTFKLNAVRDLDGISKFDACVELGDLLTLLKALEKSCRHLDGDIDVLELKSQFYSWEPKANCTLNRAFDEFEKLDRDLRHCGVEIEEKERVAKLLLVMSHLPELLPLLIDIREKVEKKIGPQSVGELMVSVNSYVKHMTLIFKKSVEEPLKYQSGGKQPSFAAVANSVNVVQGNQQGKSGKNAEKNDNTAKSTCYNCGKPGHKASECKKKPKAPVSTGKDLHASAGKSNDASQKKSSAETSNTFPKQSPKSEKSKQKDSNPFYIIPKISTIY